MKFLYKNILLLVILHKTFEGWCAGFRLSRVRVTTPVEVGNDAWLDCEYETNGDQLYTLKWYNGLNEFYRWTPAETPQVRAFPVAGITVDKDMSHEGHVHLRDVRMVTANKIFQCEISAEAPSFHTDSGVASMSVIDRPDPPYLTLDRSSYRMKDNVTVGCSSTKASPEPKLNLYLNNDAIDPNQVIRASYPDNKTGLVTTEANLTFMLKHFMADNGKLKIKCTAEIDGIYWESREIEVPGDYAKYVYRRSRSSVSRTQSNLIINLYIFILLLILQASLSFFSI